MLYENYQKRIQRIAAFLSKIVRLLPLIISAVAVSAAAVGSLLAAKGNVGKLLCPSQITYGETLKCEAGAFLSDVRYEYSEKGEDDWSEEQPRLPGEYTVRAVGTTVFGNPRYGDPKSFSVLPKKISVSVVEDYIVYGDKLNVSAALAYNDTVTCDGFFCDVDSETFFILSDQNENMTKLVGTQISVKPSEKHVKIFDKDGNDITDAYVIEAASSELKIDKREIGVTVDNKYYTYNGELQYYNIYELTKGALKAGDNILATFDDALRDKGNVVNSPEFKVINQYGEDVTECYTIKRTLGILGVEKRPLNITTGDFECEYSGKEISCSNYIVDPSTPIADGQFLTIFSQQSYDSVGEHINYIKFSVIDKNGKDVTHNYSIFLNTGTIKITPKELLITTKDGEWVYDGLGHSNIVPIYEGLLAGHDISPKNITYISDVGTVENVYDVDILTRLGEPVTDNYTIKFTYGKLTVTERPINITTLGEALPYDGTYQSYPYYVTEGLVDFHNTDISEQTPAPTIRDLGKVENKFEIVIRDSDNKDVTKNYLPSYDYGTFEIIKRPVIIETSSESWIYDGEPHSSQGYVPISQYDIVAGEELILTGWQSITNVGGPVTNTCDEEYHVLRYSGIDGKKEDITYNYDVSIFFGTIEIRQRPITIKPVDTKKIYDGEPLYATEAEFSPNSEYGLVKGHKLTATFGGSQTNVGTGTSYITSYKIDGAEGDVTYNYDVHREEGLLTVDPRPITVLTGSAEKYYDRKPLTCKEYGISPNSPYGLVGDHKIFVKTTGSQTAIGESENTCDQEYTYILDSSSDITYNYDISYEWGILRVKPHAILYITSASDSKYYDRTPLTNSNYELYIKEGEIKTSFGHKLVVDVFGSRTEVGISPNEFTAFVMGKYDEDVSDYYIINLFEGTLEVRPRKIIVLTGSASKYYDGKPLTCKDFSISPDSPCDLLEGDELFVKTTGSQTKVGKSDNTCDKEYTHVLNPYSDIADYYEFSYDLGVLEVKDKNSSGGGGGDNEGEEGDDGSVGSGGAPGDTAPIVGPPDGSYDEDTVFGKIKTDKSGHIYLRQLSYGIYTGKTWTAVAPYANTLPGGFSYNYLTSIALQNSGADLHTAEFSELMLYMLPYYLGFDGGYEIQGLDTAYSGDMRDFLVYYYEMAVEYGMLKGNLGEYAEFEKEYREFVYLMYLSLDNETRAYMDGIINEQGFDPSDPQVISKVAKYIQNAATYNLKYDRGLDGESNIAIAFLENYKEGVCVHYATAATLLYRALGIPARYTVGFTISTVAGEFVEIKNPGHAWVEVYIDGVGWIPVEVTGGGPGGNGGPIGGGSVGGGGTPPKQKITIAPSYQYKIFDGLVLKADPIKTDICSVLADLIEKGYSYSVSVSGTQLEIGRGVSVIDSFILYDPSGNDVTEMFDVVKKNGVLEVLPPDQSVIRVYLYQIQKYYDGTPLRFEDGDYEIIEMEEGLTLDLKLNLSITNVGSMLLADINSDLHKYASYRVYKNGVDVTLGYTLIFDKFDGMSEPYVPIRVDKRNIVITAASAVKVYDGTPLENGTAVISRGTLVSGHTFTAFVDGSITDVGEIDNVIIDVIVYDGSEDVTDNYNLELVNGILTVISSEE